MVKEPTVLILGAGASMPYGLPSGAGLRNIICDLVDPETNYAKTLKICGGVDFDYQSEFARQFHRSNVASIDAFLSIRPEFNELGKLSIAAILCAHEIPERIMLPVDSSDDWYRYLWGIMREGTTNINDLPNNNIRFITFNYDRSLEYFLHLSAKNTYGADDATALNAVRKINILHIYGDLGQYHHLPHGATRDPARQYLSSVNKETLQIAASRINVIPDQRDDHDNFKLARLWCDEAKRIGILGFGFDPLNINRLGLINVLQERRQRDGSNYVMPQVVASTHNRTSAEIGHFRRLLCGGIPMNAVNAKCTMTLRESGLLL